MMRHIKQDLNKLNVSHIYQGKEYHQMTDIIKRLQFLCSCVNTSCLYVCRASIVLCRFSLWRVIEGGAGVAYIYNFFLIQQLIPLHGVGGAVRFLVVGTIGQRGRPPRVSSGWSSVWHRSNTGLSSTQYEQIPIILGVWPFWLTNFFFRSITFWRAYG